VNRLRILVVTHYFSTHAGGIEIVAGTLASRLSAEHDVTWAASDCDPLPDIRGGVLFLPMACVNFLERATGLPFPLWSPVALWRLWRAVGVADVVHLHDFPYIGNLAAFVFARLRRKPVLITQHVGFIPYKNPLLRVVLRLMHHTAGRIVLGNADQVVFISPVVMKYFAAFVGYRRPPVILWNGVDTDTFTTADQRARQLAREELGLDPSRPVLLFVGRFVEKKGLALIERLTRCVPDATWTLAGWGPIDPQQWGAANVRVFSGRRGSSLLPLYHAADLLVLPSIGEGLPLVVQEAMSAGIPVLVGEDTAEAVDAPQGLVFACAVAGTDAEAAWTKAIEHVLARARDGEELSARVAEFARTRWSWRTSADAYAAHFKRLVAGARADDRTFSRRK